MGLSRRFLNLIVENHNNPGLKSLRCIDLTRQHFFNTPIPQPPKPRNRSTPKSRKDATSSRSPVADAGNRTKTPPAAGAAALKMDRIWLPSPSFNFRAATTNLKYRRIHCFPAGDRRVICADQSGSCFLVDADTRRVVTMPRLHKPKLSPLSLFVPNAGHDSDGEGTLVLVMESALEAEEVGCSGEVSHQFEAFVYRKHTPIYVSKSWHSQPLPPPPFVCDSKCVHSMPPKIRAYAVVGGGSHVCVSVEGANGGGSYFLDTASYTWSHERSWTLPFHGRVENVPELKLWFGFSDKDQTLVAAADLSNMDSQPQLVGIWKEVNLPEEGMLVSQDPQLVNLGFGRFCIARYFHAARRLNGDSIDEPSDRHCAVLTGVEVAPSRLHHTNANGDRSGSDFQMITHKSRRYTSNGTDGAISTVF